MTIRRSAVVACLVLGFAGTGAGQGFEPPRLRSGSLPGRSAPQVVAGGEVLLEVTVSAGGAVSQVTTLRDTPPFTDMMREAVGSWRFEPAVENGHARAWPVLVAGVFRPPVLLGPAAGTPPRDLGKPCAEIPVPVDLVVPAYPPTALADGLVLVEVTVGTDGKVTASRSIEGNGLFAPSALDAIRKSRFRPACRGNQPVSVAAYVVFGFRSPLTPPPRPRGGP